MNADHFRKLEALYQSAPTNRYYNPTMTVAQGEATIDIAVREDFFHALGAVHGSVYFKALDDAAFFAAASMVTDVFILTASFHIHLLRPITSGTITAVGRVVSRTSRQILAEAIATDSEGHEIARGTGTFMPSKLKLEDAPGWTQPDPDTP